MPITLSHPQAAVAQVVVQGDLDALTGPELRKALLAAVQAGHTRVIVDLAAVPFVDSSGLGALVAGLKAATAAGGGLALAGLREQARLIFQVTMADRLFLIAPDADAALAALVAP